MKFVLKLVALISMAVIAFVVVGRDDHTGTAVDRTHDAEWSACKESVKAQLDNPSTANFKILGTQMRKTGSGLKIDGELEADNAFGAHRQITYECAVDAEGNVTAHLAE